MKSKRSQQKNTEDNNASIELLPNCSDIIKEAKEKETLIFDYSYGSYFGGECEIIIIDNSDKKCSVYAIGYNDFELFWKFDMPIKELDSLIKILQPARKWLRYYEVQADILDGYGWTLSYNAKDYTIKTGGYMANPWNYFRVVNKIIKQLTLYKRRYSDDEIDDKLLPVNGYKHCSWYNAGTK